MQQIQHGAALISFVWVFSFALDFVRVVQAEFFSQLCQISKQAVQRIWQYPLNHRTHLSPALRVFRSSWKPVPFYPSLWYWYSSVLCFSTEGSSLEEIGFNWGEYLEETGASAAPHTSFKHVRDIPSLPIYIRRVGGRFLGRCWTSGKGIERRGKFSHRLEEMRQLAWFLLAYR